MKRSISWIVVLTVVASLVFAPGLFSQIKQDPASKKDQIEGTVQSIDAKAGTFVIRQKGTGNLDYTIIYNDKTTFTYRNGPAKVADLKDGVRVVAIGKAEGATKLNAERIDIRQK